MFRDRFNRDASASAVRFVVLASSLVGLTVAGAFATQAPKPPGRGVERGAYSAAQATRGAAVWERECSTCHGEKLEGGEGAPPLAGPAFSAAYGGQSIAALFTRIRETMPAPPEQPGKLTPQQTADVVAHILSSNGFPAGNADLPADSSQLDRLVIPGKPQLRAR